MTNTTNRISNKFLLLIVLIYISGCDNEENLTKSDRSYITKNIVLVTIDGPRFSETWGSTSNTNIPFQRKLAQEGIFFDHFNNNGPTLTISGHAAILSGHYEILNNNGQELPSHHSFLQQYLSTTLLAPDKAWLITSKSKMTVLGDTKDLNWRGSYLPSQDAIQRPDIETLNAAITIFDTYKPRIAFIHFREPDSYGHDKNWQGYVNAISTTDNYVNDLWNYLQSNQDYAGTTTMLITNDHGRHLDGISSGFEGHGDGCEGCRHISLLALGPDFDQNKTISTEYSQIDLAPTIAKLMGFDWIGEGHEINELTNKN